MSRGFLSAKPQLCGWVCLPWTRCDRLVHQELPGGSTAPGSAWKGARSRAAFPFSPSCSKELCVWDSLVIQSMQNVVGWEQFQSCSSGHEMAAEIRKAASCCWHGLPQARWAPQPESLSLKSAFWGAQGLPAVSTGSEAVQ